MECTNTRPLKPNSNNISEIIGKFAKVCKFKSIGVFFSESPILYHLQHNNKPIFNEVPLSGIINNVASEEIRSCDLKIHPHPIEVVAKEDECDGFEVVKNVFDSVSALKLAYLQLQQAHIPYDPKKIIAADDRVVAELQKLCKFKREYKAMQCRKERFTGQLQAEIEAKEAFLFKLRSQNSARDTKILWLQHELHDLEIGNENVEEKIKRISVSVMMKKEASVSNVDEFKDVFNAASKSIHDFAKPLIALLKASSWDLDKAANAIENGVIYSRRCDKKYAFEAYIARRMFHGIVTLSSYDVSDVIKFDEPIEFLMANPDSYFAKFCQAKYLLVVHPTMEESFFGNLDHRAFIMSGRHPRTEFYQLFAKMAKWIWILLGSAASIDPNAALFAVSRGSMFSSLHMESVEEQKDSEILSAEARAAYKVQFMIMPGFKISQTSVKSHVYVAKHP